MKFFLKIGDVIRKMALSGKTSEHPTGVEAFAVIVIQRTVCMCWMPVHNGHKINENSRFMMQFYAGQKKFPAIGQ